MFIDQVITKIWAFQYKVFGLGDPSDCKPIHRTGLFHWRKRICILGKGLRSIRANGLMRLHWL